MTLCQFPLVILRVVLNVISERSVGDESSYCINSYDGESLLCVASLEIPHILYEPPKRTCMHRRTPYKTVVHDTKQENCNGVIIYHTACLFMSRNIVPRTSY